MKYSEDYQRMLDLHREAHEEGVDRIKDGEVIPTEGRRVFEGSEILPMLPTIKELMNDLELTSLLDFGCGKGNAYYLSFPMDGEMYANVYEYLNIPTASVHLYDPCVDAFANKPRQEQTYDVVVCTDVLEHIPEQDVDTVLEEMVYHADKLMVFKIAAHESFAHFKDGTNAHVTVKPASWWNSKIIKAAEATGRLIYLHIYVEDRTDEGVKGNICRHVVNRGDNDDNTG